MASESNTDIWSSRVWFRRPEVLHVGAYLLIGMAAVVECTLVLFGAGKTASLGGVLGTVAGAALAWWQPWPGLVVAAGGCVLSAVLGGIRICCDDRRIRSLS